MYYLLSKTKSILVITFQTQKFHSPSCRIFQFLLLVVVIIFSFHPFLAFRKVMIWLWHSVAFITWLAVFAWGESLPFSITSRTWPKVRLSFHVPKRIIWVLVAQWSKIMDKNVGRSQFNSKKQLWASTWLLIDSFINEYPIKRAKCFYGHHVYFCVHGRLNANSTGNRTEWQMKHPSDNAQLGFKSRS